MSELEEMRKKYDLPEGMSIANPKHFIETMEFAENLGGEPLESLKNALEQFKRMIEAQGLTLKLYPDFVPYSFEFTYEKDGRFVYNGGLICHGLGVQTLTVELSPRAGVHWSIHT